MKYYLALAGSLVLILSSTSAMAYYCRQQCYFVPGQAACQTYCS